MLSYPITPTDVLLVQQEVIKMEILQKFQTPDGQVFDTKAEAFNHVRRPKILAALHKLTDNNQELSTWLIDNQEHVEVAFELGTIRRVTKSERKKLEKSIEELKTLSGNPKLAFLVENADVIAEVFRWPTVKRMTDEEKAFAAKNTLMGASGNNEELASWIIANKDGVLAAYEAGVEKREVNPKATEALAAYRAKKAAEKAEGAAATAPAATPPA